MANIFGNMFMTLVWCMVAIPMTIALSLIAYFVGWQAVFALIGSIIIVQLNSVLQELRKDPLNTRTSSAE